MGRSELHELNAGRLRAIQTDLAPTIWMGSGLRTVWTINAPIATINGWSPPCLLAADDSDEGGHHMGAGGHFEPPLHTCRLSVPRSVAQYAGG